MTATGTTLPPGLGRPASPNFAFLATRDPSLVRIAAQAERLCFEDPNTSLIKSRQLCELLARQVAARVGLATSPDAAQLDVLRGLQDKGVLPREIADLFHNIRKVGNAATHGDRGTRSDALGVLKWARQAAIWAHRTLGAAKDFRPGPFVPPAPPADADQALSAALTELNDKLREHAREAEAAKAEAATHAKARARAEARAATAEQAATAAEQLALEAEQAAANARAQAELEAAARTAALEADRDAALQLAEETEQQMAAERARFEAMLAAQVAAAQAAPAAEIQAVVAAAQQAATRLDLDERDTRRLIDAQLREAGWEVDSETMRWESGTRPQKGRNVAIAEVPTADGRADYVLYCDLTPVATVEAKRRAINVAGAVRQAERYSRGYRASVSDGSPGGPWDDFKVPFVFATNGRPYLKQVAEQSGIWFRDARRSINHSRALDGWYSPEGLRQLLAQDFDAAETRLRNDSADFLLLRDYQFAAIHAAETAVLEGKRAALLAMATGTGKTRTCLGLVYRLLKTQRFRRVLFLVDRTTLGEQAADVFKTVKLENLQSFVDIYNIKELGDLRPDPETRLHVATIQGMVRRVLAPRDDEPRLPVDAYDCIVVDECHRGYNLDKEMSDAEITFRSLADYVSNYTRVLDYFDAFKIALTATPALHTTEIFGRPVYEYSYRQAVIDGYLVDHDPPIRIVTKLARDGITWERGEEVKVLDIERGQLDLFQTPDEIDIEIDQFNKRVVTESFNRVVCAELARQIDPTLPGKTLVFCASDSHADMVVRLLKDAFTELYGEVEDKAVAKITGYIDRADEMIRHLKNERLPSVAVTVDLLTTGIDVPAIDKLVFLRRVKSRILYEQMLGRATRLCPDLYGPGEPKEAFRIFDAVDLYSALEPYTAMRPVVTKPDIGFEQLTRELAEAATENVRAEVLAQFVAKLRRKVGRLDAETREQLEAMTGHAPKDFLDAFASMPPEEAAEFVRRHPALGAFLDQRAPKSPRYLLISDHEDELVEVAAGYGNAKKPEDYLEEFGEYLRTHINEVPALLVVTQRPGDLTREELKKLKLELDREGYRERDLQAAYKAVANRDIAASIIGFVRQKAIGSPLVPYEERVQKALEKILASRAWTDPQRRWLDRIGKAMRRDVVVDRAALDQAQFQSEGGFNRMNKIFGGQLETILGQIGEEVWRDSA